MAVDQDIISVFAASDDQEVQISNANPSFKYSNRMIIDFNENFFSYFLRSGSFNVEKFSISYDKSDWYEYFKCGVQGIRDKYPDMKLKGTK